jgi:hypothetical protein
MRKLTSTPFMNPYFIGTEVVSSKKLIPDWFKNLPISDVGAEDADETNFTAKACVPFLDALTLGYSISLTRDVTFGEDENGFFIESHFEHDVDTHGPGQYSTFPIEEKYYPIAFKWLSHNRLTPPEGYSLIFTHPLNRFDLPFLTLTGFVDSDRYNMPVHLPFLLEKDFRGTIKAGTPLAQVIPVKREEWRIIREQTLPEVTQEDVEKSLIPRNYKNNFWVKKRYL